MAELVFYVGPMDCGKSALALQTDHNHARAGRVGLRLTRGDRGGPGLITSRLGLSAEAEEVGEGDDVRALVSAARAGGLAVDYVVCDEAQFLTPAQVEQLVDLVDSDGVDVLCFGIATDFRSRLFPGAARLYELADSVQELQLRTLCWCGRPGRLNARVVDGTLVREGSVVLVADTAGIAAPGPDAHEVRGQESLEVAGGDPLAAGVHYRVLCRRHWRAGELS